MIAIFMHLRSTLFTIFEIKKCMNYGSKVENRVSLECSMLSYSNFVNFVTSTSNLAANCFKDPWNELNSWFLKVISLYDESVISLNSLISPLIMNKSLVHLLISSYLISLFLKKQSYLHLLTLILFQTSSTLIVISLCISFVSCNLFILRLVRITLKSTYIIVEIDDQRRKDVNGFLQFSCMDLKFIFFFK